MTGEQIERCKYIRNIRTGKVGRVLHVRPHPVYSTLMVAVTVWGIRKSGPRKGKTYQTGTQWACARVAKADEKAFRAQKDELEGKKPEKQDTPMAIQGSIRRFLSSDPIWPQDLETLTPAFWVGATPKKTPEEKPDIPRIRAKYLSASRKRTPRKKADGPGRTCRNCGKKLKVNRFFCHECHSTLSRSIWIQEEAGVGDGMNYG